MEKKFIATTLAGLFVRSDPWAKAHEVWFEQKAEQLNDPSIKDWIKRSDYFQGVDEVMKRIIPHATEEERTKKAREEYFDSVEIYLTQNKHLKNDKVIEYFKTLKNKYHIALITTTKRDRIAEILSILEITELFDSIETSLPEEKDDKILVFERFIQKQGNPVLYIGGPKIATYLYCKQKNIPYVFANLEHVKEVDDIPTINSLEKLKEKIESLKEILF